MAHIVMAYIVMAHANVYTGGLLDEVVAQCLASTAKHLGVATLAVNLYGP